MSHSKDRNRRVDERTATPESPRAGRQRTFGASLRWHWIRTAVVLLLLARYTQLVLTTGAPPHLVFLMAFLGLVATYSLVTLVRAHRQSTRQGR